MKHTKGNWKISTTGAFIESNGIVICAVSMNTTERLSNALLISTAPDLLQICIEVEKYHQGGHSVIGKRLREVIENATKG